MTHYVLLPRSRSISAEARKILGEQPGVEVVDETYGKALLIEATDDAAASLRVMLPDWIISPETSYPRTAQILRSTID